ncbi:hypothetical protein BV25DRAFT_1569082 [Artomyces pyxidatus]|uniref:Uncharacterized protein n=1 Tax=Artomyces pyxidatus TaxID=48021 RepID=A0ACB8SKS8_9AGAM|nr:hypothetical protein BV25DRAFT_1569082 [Artomyces pyxidatus]
MPAALPLARVRDSNLGRRYRGRPMSRVSAVPSRYSQRTVRPKITNSRRTDHRLIMGAKAKSGPAIPTVSAPSRLASLSCYYCAGKPGYRGIGMGRRRRRRRETYRNMGIEGAPGRRAMQSGSRSHELFWTAHSPLTPLWTVRSHGSPTCLTECRFS